MAPSVSGAAASSADLGRCLAGSGSPACYTATVVRPAVVVAGAVAPGAPTGLTATASGSSVTLTWSAPTSGDPAQSYTIEAGSTSGASNLANFATGNTATRFSTSGVPNGTYFVRVRASNSVGVSSASNEATLVVGPPACTAAPTPGTLSGTASASGTVVLTWTAASGSPTSYVLEAGSAPGLSNLANSDLGGTARTFTANNVGPGTYYIRVRAKNACGVGPASNEIQLTVSGPVIVPNVVNLTRDAATIAIRNAGLTVGFVTIVSSTTVPSGSVISQNPVAGTQVTAGSLVNLTVSSGAPGPYDGNWTGTRGGADQGITFSVTNSVISRLVTTYVCASVQFQHPSSSITIRDGAFQFTITTGSLVETLVGTFTSASTASGTALLGISFCPDAIPWNATKR
jgi:predicted phage tail protein